MKYETQKRVVINHLVENKSLTSWEAITKYHITRLSAIIYDLREVGYDIKTIREYNPETGANYARYVFTKSEKWTEDNLTSMSKEDFLNCFNCSDPEYEMEQKALQEM